jgi:cytochrome c-type biogenesis protein CcmE
VTVRRLVPVALVAVAALGLLAVSGLGDSLVYYRTPSEVVADPPPAGSVVRLGGMVQAGSVRPDGGGVRFALTDGVTDVEVLHVAEVRGVFAEGQGALVEGSLGADGVFRSQLLMVQHDNEYQRTDQEESR